MSCETSTTPTVDSLASKVEIIRFDQALLELDTSQLSAELVDLKQQYPAMFKTYFEQLIPITPPDSINTAKLKDYITNVHVRKALNQIQEKYPDMNLETEELGQALAYFKYYLPKSEIPQLYTLYGDFSYQAFIFEEVDGTDAIGISLDLFLGPDYPYKALDPQNPIFSDYISRRYTREYIPIKVMGILIEDLLGPLPGKRLIDFAIYEGKKQYLLSKLFPERTPAQLLEYTEAEYEWCVKSQLGIWDLYLDQELIYETNQKKINSYVNEAPRAKGMPEISPGRTAHFLGYQIVKAYMEKTESTLTELINMKESEEIFRKSKYKPKRN